jgi:hypothetical protein
VHLARLSFSGSAAYAISCNCVEQAYPPPICSYTRGGSWMYSASDLSGLLLGHLYALKRRTQVPLRGAGNLGEPLLLSSSSDLVQLAEFHRLPWQLLLRLGL